MTNREWLNTLSDEEFAKYLEKKELTVSDDFGLDITLISPSGGEFSYSCDRDEYDYDNVYTKWHNDVVAWLKDEHKEEK